ncbi:uncharacterized protein LOC143822608 isoform X2 [Paroedura picta]|uniref:uncharacterized protein LOC143822608 isoform X2 n=1 Tax=Paroedura picta TaxID=143630 RepID=UPI004055FACE
MGGRWPVLIEVSCRGGGGRKGGEKRGCRRAMAKAAGLGVGLLLLLLLVLLRGASLEWPPGGPCCAWRAESVEWPVGASQCPAEGTRPDANANASYCCGLCFSGEAQEDDEGAWPDGDAACPPARHEDWTPLRSAASPEPGRLLGFGPRSDCPGRVPSSLLLCMAVAQGPGRGPLQLLWTTSW